MINFVNSIPLILTAIGISAVITGSKIGFPIRLIWCFIFQNKYTRWLWGMVRCPYCNSFWSGAFVTFILVGFNPIQILQIAFTCCGLMLILQTALGGDGIAMVDDFEEFFDSSVTNEKE